MPAPMTEPTTAPLTEPTVPLAATPPLSPAPAAQVDSKDPRFKQRLKQDMLKINAPRMLAFCIVYVVLQVATIFLNGLFSISGLGDLASSAWVNEGAWIAFKIVALCVGVVFAVLFALVVSGVIRIPKTQNTLMQAALIVLTCAQILLGVFEFTSAFAILNYAVYALMLGVLPIQSRAASTVYLVVFTLLYWCVGLFFLLSNVGIFANPSIAEVPTLGALDLAALTLGIAFSSGAMLIVPVVLLASLSASWLSFGLVKKQCIAQVEFELKEEARRTLTEKRIAEYKEKARAAEVANLAKTRFLNRTSHEMRTSLNTISGMTFLAKESDDPESARESLEAIDLASQKLKDIVGGIIDTAKIELEFSGDESSQDFALLRADAAQPQHKNEVVKAPDLSGRTILIVEDLETNRLVLREFLKDTHANIEEAPNGKLAVEMFSASPENYYSFVFMDLLMPEMNGHDATRAIRKLERDDATVVPIVAVSANAFTEDIEASLAAGMDAHLAKPVGQATIFRTLIERLN